jgi:hypothetical protein
MGSFLVPRIPSWLFWSLSLPPPSSSSPENPSLFFFRLIFLWPRAFLKCRTRLHQYPVSFPSEIQ